jgi:predicted phosphate transport protein (TIGR00153 family)
MRNLFKRESKVEQYSKEHVDMVYESLNQLKILMGYFYNNEFDKIDKKVDEISQLEHKADDIRRKMEIEFFNGAFLPFDREDRIILAENVDSISDMCQETAFGICMSRINFPKGYVNDFSDLMKSIYETVTALKKCIELLDEDLGEALKKAHEVERLEDEVDRIERRILKRLYISYKNQEIDILTHIEIKSTVLRLGNIADRAENASDRVPIIVAKRKG